MLKYDIYVHKLHKRRRPLLEHVKPKAKYEKKMNKKNMRGINHGTKPVLLQIS